MEEETIVERLSDKSRSLRRTSVKKRLQTEINKEKSAVKGKGLKKRQLSKYRRKAANAKERERMKKMNDVFATLKSVIPVDNKNDQEEEKETKVTTLRSAIDYINCLKQLIDDCDAGLVDRAELLGKHVKQTDVGLTPKQKSASPKIKKAGKKSPQTLKSVVKSSKPILLDSKWTNYSPQFLEHKFSITKDPSIDESRNIYQADRSSQNILLHPLPDITIFNKNYHYTSSTCSSSPRDVNEVSLHISLLESDDTLETENGYKEKNICDLDFGKDVNIISVVEGNCELIILILVGLIKIK